MATYYVRKSGNDSTGDGSTGNPWLTLTKAMATMSTAGGHTLLIGDGDFAEDTSALGYWLIAKNFTAPVTIRGENYDANLVTIHGTSGTTYDTLISATTNNIIFQSVSFVMRTNATANGAIRIAQGTNLTFNSCNFIGLTASGQHRYGLYMIESGASAISNVVFNGCWFITTSGGFSGSYGAFIAKGGGTISGISFNLCHMLATGYCLYATGGSDINVTGGDFHTAAAATVAYGLDDVTNPKTITGYIDGALISSNTSHACLIGAGASGVILRNSKVVGGDLGVVVKECVNAQILNNVIGDGTNGSLYFKGATGATASYNRIKNSVGGWCIRIGQGDTGDKVANITVTHNVVISQVTSKIFQWASTDDTGGGVVDYNIYQVDGSGLFGLVRANASVATLPLLRTAWAGYGDGSNDSHSQLKIEEEVGYRFLLKHAR